jgi:hypothetical protein
MLSIGLSEILLVIVVAIVALKPQQMIESVKMFRTLWADWTRWRAGFEATQLKAEKETELLKRTLLAAKVSDVSDLLNTPDDKQP